MERNLKIMKYYMSLSLPFMLGPIIHKYYFSRGLQISDFYILFSVSLISVFIFEVPTGVIADRIGYKQSLIFGSITMFLSLSGMLFANNIVDFIICEILYGLGASFISGADAGLIYDTLICLDRQEEYRDIFGKSRQYLFFAAGVGSLISSMIFSVNNSLPILINLLFVGLTIFIAFLIEEPAVVHQVEKYSYRKQLNIVSNHIFNNKKIWAVILLSSILFIFYRPSINLYQPYFDAMNINVFYNGFIFFGLNIVAKKASSSTNEFYRLTKNNPLIGLIVILIITHILLSIPVLIIGLFGMGLNQIVRGLYKPIVSTYVNDLTSSDIRATTLSFVSLLNSLIAGVAALGISVLASKFYIFQFAMVLAVLLTASTVCIYFIIVKKYNIR